MQYIAIHTKLTLFQFIKCSHVQTLDELKLQGKIHTLSTVSFSPIESLPMKSELDFVTGKEREKEKEKDRIKTPNFSSSCTSTDCSSEAGSRYSSVGVSDSWLQTEKEKEAKSRDEGRIFNSGEGYKDRGRREGGKEYRDASKWEKNACSQLNIDMFAHFNSPYPYNPPPRNSHSHK